MAAKKANRESQESKQKHEATKPSMLESIEHTQFSDREMLQNVVTPHHFSPIDARTLQRTIGNWNTTCVLQGKSNLTNTLRVQRYGGFALGAMGGTQPITPIAKDNPASLADLNLEKLGMLYATLNASVTLSQLRKEDYFTAPWIQGPGRKAIEVEITKKLPSASERALANLWKLTEDMHASVYDPSRKEWLQHAISPRLLLTPEQREECRRIVGDKMTAAFTAYTSAAKDVAASIKAAVDSNATFLSVFVDVVLGFIAPGMASLIKKGVVKFAGSLVEKGGGSVLESRRAFEILMAENLDEKVIERLWAATVKVGKEAIKANGKALSGQTDLDLFVDQLEKSFQAGVQKVNKGLRDRTDVELLILDSKFDVENTDKNTYKPIIKDLLDRFQQEVHPIGVQGQMVGAQGPRIPGPKKDPTADLYFEVAGYTLAWAAVDTHEYLVQIVRAQTYAPHFQRFISLDLADTAIARKQSVDPGPIEVLPWTKIAGFPIDTFRFYENLLVKRK